VVIPKLLRDRVGLRAGAVVLTVNGSAIRIEPVTDEVVVEEDGRLVIPSAGGIVDDDLVRALRDADRR
jgi:bifunctional DNA-binding transcriptional regulator/antitoxin component of YhaV-PrlF toxin-antitoxin module